MSSWSLTGWARARARRPVIVSAIGKLDVLETTWDSTEATAASLLQRAPLRFVYARLHLDVRRGGSTHIRVIPSARGQRLVLHHAHRLVIRLWVSYTPTGGVQRNIGIYGVHITP